MIKENVKSTVVVVPIYSNKMSILEEKSFLRMIKVFKNREITIVSPYSLKEFSSKLAAANNLNVTFFSNDYFKGIKGYNRLLICKDFYNRFINFNYLLICQLDVYVIKDEIDYWTSLNLDNIGAPIFEGYSNPSEVFKKNGNNGGFCLRNISNSLKVLSKIKFRYSKFSTLISIEKKWFWKLYRFLRDGLIFNYKIKYLRPIINEDVFWSMIVPKQFSFFKVCPPEKAMFFAFDANPKLLYKKCENRFPMAIHAWWRYDKDFVEELIENYNLNK